MAYCSNCPAAEATGPPHDERHVRRAVAGGRHRAAGRSLPALRGAGRDCHPVDLRRVRRIGRPGGRWARRARGRPGGPGRPGAAQLPGVRRDLAGVRPARRGHGGLRPAGDGAGTGRAAHPYRRPAGGVRTLPRGRLPQCGGRGRDPGRRDPGGRHLAGGPVRACAFSGAAGPGRSARADVHLGYDLGAQMRDGDPGQLRVRGRRHGGSLGDAVVGPLPGGAAAVPRERAVLLVRPSHRGGRERGADAHVLRERLPRAGRPPPGDTCQPVRRADADDPRPDL